MKTYLYSMLALCVSAACHAETYPAPIGPSQSDFGGVGLLQTPTARMAREGKSALTIAITISTVTTLRPCSCSPAGDHAALHRRAYKTVQQRGCLLRRPDL